MLGVHYKEDNPLENLEGKTLQAVHALCFSGDKLVIVYSEEKGYWSYPGGMIDPGETYEEAVVREVREETNMKVIHQELIGYHDVYEPNGVVRQTRSFCVVEPIGDFVSDPDGDVTEIKLIDPIDIKKYFNWGVVGDRLMTRALELKKFT